LGRKSKPEPEVTVLNPQRTERRPLVGDMGIRYPFSGDDVCVLDGSPLSRYNPHVICFKCVKKVQVEAAATMDQALRDLLNRRRKRNPGCPRPSSSLNFGLIEQCITTGMSRGRHHPQNGHQ